jgi:tetratricopeptide (TPR) repeat protein
MSKAKKSRSRGKGGERGKAPKGRPTPKRKAANNQWSAPLATQLLDKFIRLAELQEAEHPDTDRAAKLAEIQPLLDQYETLMQAGEYREAYALLNRSVAQQADGESLSLLDRLSSLDDGEAQRIMAQLLTPTAAASLEPADLAALLKRFRWAMPFMPAARKIVNRAEVCISLLPLLEEHGDDESLMLALSAIVHDYRMKGQPKLALEYQQRLTKVAERRGNREEIICELMEQARLHATLKQAVAAAAQRARVDRMFAEAADASEQMKIIDTVIGCSSIFAANEWEESYRQRVLELAPHTDLPRLDRESLAWIAGDYIEAEQFVEALPYQERLIELLEQEGDQRALVQPLADLAYLYGDLNRDEDKLRTLKRVNGMDEPTNKDFTVGILEDIIAIAEKLSRPEEAASYQEQLRQVRGGVTTPLLK